MSLPYQRGVLAHSKSKGASRLVLMIVAFHANERGECWPKIATIAEEMNGSPSAVDRAILKLKKLGEIEVTKRGHGRSALFKILLTPINKPVTFDVLDEGRHVKSDGLNSNKHPKSDGLPKNRHVTFDVSNQTNTSLLKNKHVKSDVHELNMNLNKKELKRTTSTSSESEQDEFSRIFRLYSDNIGHLTPLQIDDFGDTFDSLNPPNNETCFDWFEYAILAAVNNDKSNWAYTRAILEKINRAGSLEKHQKGHSHDESASTSRNGHPRTDADRTTRSAGAGRGQKII